MYQIKRVITLKFEREEFSQINKIDRRKKKENNKGANKHPNSWQKKDYATSGIHGNLSISHNLAMHGTFTSYYTDNSTLPPIRIWLHWSSIQEPSGTILSNNSIISIQHIKFILLRYTETLISRLTISIFRSLKVKSKCLPKNQKINWIKTAISLYNTSMGDYVADACRAFSFWSINGNFGDHRK